MKIYKKNNNESFEFTALRGVCLHVGLKQFIESWCCNPLQRALPCQVVRNTMCRQKQGGAQTRAGEPEPAGAGRSRVFLAPWSRSRSRLKKKRGAGAGAAWKKSQEPEPEPVKISRLLSPARR